MGKLELFVEDGFAGANVGFSGGQGETLCLNRGEREAGNDQ